MVNKMVRQKSMKTITMRVLFTNKRSQEKIPIALIIMNKYNIE
jgi:hypothetical protein